MVTLHLAFHFVNSHSKAWKRQFTTKNKEGEKRKKGGKVQVYFISRAAPASLMAFGHPGLKKTRKTRRGTKEKFYFDPRPAPKGPVVAGQPGKLGKGWRGLEGVHLRCHCGGVDSRVGAPEGVGSVAAAGSRQHRQAGCV